MYVLQKMSKSAGQDTAALLIVIFLLVEGD